MEERKGGRREGGTVKRREEGRQVGKKEGRKERRKGKRKRWRKEGSKERKEGGREGDKCKVKKKKLMTSKLNEATVSLSVLIGLKMKSMSTQHTQ